MERVAALGAPGVEILVRDLLPLDLSGRIS